MDEEVRRLWNENNQLIYDLAQGHGIAQVGAGSLSVSSLNHLPIRYYAALTVAWSRTSISIVTT